MRLPIRSWEKTWNKLGFRRVRKSKVSRQSGTGHRLTSPERLEARVLMTTNWVVTTLSDASSHTGLSLRDAIADAAASTGDDVITFDASLFNGQPQQINLTSSLTMGSVSNPIAGNITIQGPGGQSISRQWPKFRRHYFRFR